MRPMLNLILKPQRRLMLQLKLKTLLALKNPQKRRNIVKHILMFGNISKEEKWEMMVFMRQYVIIVGNVISKKIKGALVFWNITLWKVARKFYGQKDIVKLMHCRRCCRLAMQ
jgi:hypothetical protein